VIVLPPDPIPLEPKPQPKPKPDPWTPHPNMPDPIPSQPQPEEPVDPNAPAKPKKKIPWKTIAVVLGALTFALKFVPIVPAIVPTILDWCVKILNSLPG
jgi:hypothetical protein